MAFPQRKEEGWRQAERCVRDWPVPWQDYPSFDDTIGQGFYFGAMDIYLSCSGHILQIPSHNFSNWERVVFFSILLSFVEG